MRNTNSINFIQVNIGIHCSRDILFAFQDAHTNFMSVDDKIYTKKRKKNYRKETE